MKSFGLAIGLWAGTITLSGSYVIIATVLDPDPWALVSAGVSILVLFVAYFLLCPLLVPVVTLIKISQKIPYGTTAKIFWLGFILAAANAILIGLYCWMGGVRSTKGMIELYTVPTVAVFIMVFLYRGSLRKLYSQQILSHKKNNY